MKLSKIYSNKPGEFKPIKFSSGLNVILGEIRLPENKKKDTHNLGKTTLLNLIKFCFLQKKDPKLFLFKHFDLFQSYVFFLELELNDGKFLTLRRSVANPTKISFKSHNVGDQDFSTLGNKWDHDEVPLERAKELLDGYLNWKSMNPWGYRKIMPYLLRSQENFKDLFCPNNRFKDGDWKPFLAHILGFDAKLLNEHYVKESEISKKKQEKKTIESVVNDQGKTLSQIEGILLLKQQEEQKLQEFLDEFNFDFQDKATVMDLVKDTNDRIASLNLELYSLVQNKKKIDISLNEDTISFNPNKAEKLFEEAGILFGGQIKKDFEQLISFNKSITEERASYLQEELQEIDKRLSEVDLELSNLEQIRSEQLGYLGETDPFRKYKESSHRIAILRGEIQFLKEQKKYFLLLDDLNAKIHSLEKECEDLRSDIELNVREQNTNEESLFSKIRICFSFFSKEVIDKKALLSVSLNKRGHLEFSGDILGDGDMRTSADDGHTYRKLLCIAFDMAILKSHLIDKFPRFTFHDGALESLDDRKKQNLVSVFRDYASLGIQSIITVIDSDIPHNDRSFFKGEEIILTLHDEGNDGRLFKMKEF
ncbi:DUF2326 domain-containing protein [Acetobacteraceae bacterium]|nr:DUF2326 domain-containing protein [Acetobacteraceae bacterium]